MKILQNRLTAFLLIELGIVLALLIFVCFGTNSPQAKTSGGAPFVSANTASEEVEETVTLSSPLLKTWQWDTTWCTDSSFCRPCFVVPIPAEEVPDTEVLTGYIHEFKGGWTLTCDERKTAIFQGTVWFDLSGIISKAPVVHVKSATLLFKLIDTGAKDGAGNNITAECPDQLWTATVDWVGGKNTDPLVTGVDPLPVLCFSKNCYVDVQETVNRWVQGTKDKNGFVLKAENEIMPIGPNPKDNALCLTHYGEFSLRVTYKYNKPPIILVAPPEAPIIQRTNVALAASGGVATASTAFPGYAPSGAIDGDRKGLNFGKDGYWSSMAGLPAWLEVTFSGPKKITEIDAFFVQDNYTSPIDPGDKPMVMTFSPDKYGVTAFEVQYWDGSSWVDVGNVSGNNFVWRQFTFSPKTTTKIRILCNSSFDSYARVTELEAWTP